MSGMRKAAVLPDPVGAHASISLPLSIAGMACICTRVSSWYPAVKMFLARNGRRLNLSIRSEADWTGGGTSLPYAWMRSALRRALASATSFGVSTAAAAAAAAAAAVAALSRPSRPLLARDRRFSLPRAGEAVSARLLLSFPAASAWRPANGVCAAGLDYVASFHAPAADNRFLFDELKRAR
eukprot:6173033-Pleurochrysis_carterae.AAC.2